MDNQSGENGSELENAFGFLLIAQNENKSDEDFSRFLPDIVPDWAVDEEHNHKFDCDQPTANDLEQKSANTEKAAPSVRIIRRASRRSSIIRLPVTSNEGSIEAGPSQNKVVIEHSTHSSEENSKNVTQRSIVDFEKPCEKIEARPIKLGKPESGKCPSKPAHDVPLAEQMQRYFNEVPSRFHSLPTKRANCQPTGAAKRKSMAVQNPTLSRPSSATRGEEPNKSAGGSRTFQPPSLAKVSTKFTSSSNSSKPDLQKFTARPVPRQSTANPPPAPTRVSAVLEESNGKIETKLINTHVGVPQSECSGVRRLVVKPFSFIERNERARKLREEKLRRALEESVRFPQFKARPLPSYLAEKTNSGPSSSSKNIPKSEQPIKKADKENHPLHPKN